MHNNDFFQIIHKFIDKGFKPAYIIYESLHNKERLEKTINYLSSHNYKYLTQRGWNSLFELQANSTT